MELDRRLDEAKAGIPPLLRMPDMSVSTSDLGLMSSPAGHDRESSRCNDGLHDAHCQAVSVHMYPDSYLLLL